MKLLNRMLDLGVCASCGQYVIIGDHSQIFYDTSREKLKDRARALTELWKRQKKSVINIEEYRQKVIEKKKQCM